MGDRPLLFMACGAILIILAQFFRAVIDNLIVSGEELALLQEDERRKSELLVPLQPLCRHPVSGEGE